MSTQHTPAPWGHNPESGEVFFADGDVQPLIATVTCENAQTHGQYLADCRLIAAAPELFAIVEATAHLPLDGSAVRARLVTAANEAIAKARGET